MAGTLRLLYLRHEHELSLTNGMIIETRNGETTISHNSLADQIADCEYHIAAAQMGYAFFGFIAGRNSRE